MATLADSIVSSSSRKLAIRMRPDLEARQQRYQGRIYWVVKEPVGLQYFRFEEEEFAILQMLDGESSLEEIAEQFELDFPPQTIRVEELQNFIGMLHKSGLVLSNATGQGVQLKERRDEKKRQELIGSLSNILAFRFRGFDPEGILNGIYPWVRWFFTPTATILSCCLALAAAMLVIVQFDVFQSRLPSFQSFFSAQNWLVLGSVLMVTKIIHEFGHGLSCKHFGGECHEMGVMFLVLTPCLYCNVSDSWMLPNRWHRAAIGAAGMYVEVVIASCATFIWWFSEPGWLNYLCLNVMFVSSVSTIMFNANPLLRYDGYYILSDILEIPNLRQKASSILNRKLGKWCLGLEEQEDPFLPKRHQMLFALYTVASFLYRWVILFSILYFLNKVFEPYGLKVLGQAIALMSLYGLLVMPFWKLFKFFRVPGRIHKVKRLRMFVSLLLIAGAIGAILLVPLPASVMAVFELQPHGAESVYFEAPGILEWAVEPGVHVEKGDLLAKLENVDLEMEVAQLEGEQAALETQIETLQRMRFGEGGEQAGLELSVTREKLAATKDQLAQKLKEQQKLRLLAPIAGTVIPPLRVPERTKGNEEELEDWSGSPLDEQNRGALVSPDGPQNLLCQIGDPNQWDAVIVIEQDDIVDIREGQEARLMFDESAYHVFVSQVEFDAVVEMDVAPPRLASTSGGPLAAQPGPDGTVRPLEKSYYVLARIDDSQHMLRNGLIGRARITTEPRTIAARIGRYLARTFNFEL